MVDKLTEISINDLPLLKTVYTPDGSKNYTAFTTIDTYIRRFDQDPNVKHIEFLCLNGDFSDGIFVVTDRCDAYADTFNESYDRLSQLIQLIDYTKGYTFRSIRTELLPVITNALKKINVRIQSVTDLLLHYLPKEDALKLDVHCSNSLRFIQNMAKYNPNVGAFTEDGTPVAWVLRFPTGPLAALQTDEKHYGKGYGGLVLRSLSKMIGELGHDGYGAVLKGNTVSLALFRKHGFKIVCEFHLIQTKITWNPADE